MPSQPTSGQATGLAFRPAEWKLLTRLPAQVMIAATSAETDSAWRTVAEGLAGLDAIAAGHTSTSQLVRAVVAAIFTESDDERPAEEEFTDRAAGLADVLAACRAASAVLVDRVASGDAEAYRRWLIAIAEAVCGARTSTADRQFLADLAVALRS
jgi:hypothetical protein